MVMKSISYREESAGVNSGNYIIPFCWKLQGCGVWECGKRRN